jgi:hypothetical protein
MDTELVQDEVSPLRQEPKNSTVLDARETIIEFCYELVCLGRPFSEILAEAKRRSDTTKIGQFEITGEASYPLGCEGPNDVLSQSGARCESPSRPVWITSDNPLFCRAYGFARRLRSPRIIVAAVIFSLTLILLFAYVAFSKAHQNSQAALLQNAHDRVHEVSESLMPILKDAAIGDLAQLGRQLERFAGTGVSIKLLLAPAGGDGERFYYAGSWPMSAVEVERQTLTNQGILDRLPQTCQSQTSFSLIDARVINVTEVIAVTPISTAAGCWVVVTTFSADALKSSKHG